MRIFSYLAFACTICVSAAVAAEQIAVTSKFTAEQVADLVARLQKAPASKFLTKETGGPNGPGVRVVFIQGGTRYTLDYSWYSTGISVWTRPQGTQHPNPKAEAHGDANLDGIVDSGVGNVLPFFNDGVGLPELGQRNLNSQADWQKVYDQTLTDLEQALK